MIRLRGFLESIRKSNTKRSVVRLRLMCEGYGLPALFIREATPRSFEAYLNTGRVFGKAEPFRQQAAKPKAKTSVSYARINIERSDFGDSNDDARTTAASVPHRMKIKTKSDRLRTQSSWRKPQTSIHALSMSSAHEHRDHVRLIIRDRAMVKRMATRQYHEVWFHRFTPAGLVC